MITNIILDKTRDRFAYGPFDDSLIIPKIDFFNTFRWVISSISHEELHKIIFDLEGYEATKNLDNLGYNLITGCIEKKNKETILTYEQYIKLNSNLSQNTKDLNNRSESILDKEVK